MKDQQWATTPSTSSSDTPSTTSSAATPPAERQGESIRESPQPKTRQILESMCLALRTEHNAGRMSLSNPVVLSMYDPAFQAVISPDRLNLEEYIARLNYIYERYPGYHVDVTRMDTIIDERKGTARVFVDFGISGIFEGVTRASVAVLKFREVEKGAWRLCRYEAADGMDGNGRTV